jgi:nucleoside-diphosphate-sugar epimerase
MQAVEPGAKALRHVCLAQGSKYYGRHLGPHKTPAKEDDDRAMPPNFYYDQQDYLSRLQEGKAWSWSCVRPQAVCGHAPGFPLNLVPVIAVFATLSKALGLPLRFPGKPGAYTALYSVTDAGLLARSMAWMATEPKCANQAFNITNGDAIRWQYTWPKIADYFAMETGPVQEIDLIHMMADKGALWDDIVARHGLAPMPFDKAVNWWFGNYAFGSDWDVFSDTTKCRTHGFLEFMDTEEMFRHQFDALRRIKFIP